MRRLTRLLGATLLVALVGCSPGAPAASGGAPTGRPTEVVRDDLQETYELTWGDPGTRRAAEVLARVEYEERLAQCLAERGAGHVPGPFVDAGEREPGPLSWFDPLLPVDGAGDLLVPRERPTAELVPTRTWPGRAPTSADLEACVPGPPEVPAVDPALDDRLYELVEDALGDAVEVDGYGACLADAGFEAATRDDLVDVVLLERTADGAPGQRERDAVVADAACRADAHGAAMAALDEPLRAFREQHAVELAALPGRAAALEQQAREAADRIGLAIDW